MAANYYLNRTQVIEAGTHLEAMHNLIEAIGETREPARRQELWDRYFEHRAELEKIVPTPDHSGD
jgi:hypothetical protein